MGQNNNIVTFAVSLCLEAFICSVQTCAGHPPAPLKGPRTLKHPGGTVRSGSYPQESEAVHPARTAPRTGSKPVSSDSYTVAPGFHTQSVSISYLFSLINRGVSVTVSRPVQEHVILSENTRRCGAAYAPT